MQRCFSKKQKSNKGFTLIELLVVLSIIGIVSGFTVLNWQFLQDQFQLNQITHQTIQDIRRVSQSAVSTQEQPVGVSCGPGEAFVGYGIHFHLGNNFYTIFGNCRNVSNGRESMEPIEVIQLEHGSVISSITFDSGGGGPWEGTRISFFPPDPRAQVSWDHSNNSVNRRPWVEIGLQLDGREKIIRVTDKGAVSTP